ncbi:ABC transporter ATP-binding protein [Curtobacterium sp. 18060]|uniref:ABC transporter ATP-binding protein n=1 Tax=Curtobacterium sp. 18060 TaxID=2681408 RepID=UPI0013599A84|nr:ABC transporter ATP-binding protein [Curtobacterium sp. 18060]
MIRNLFRLVDDAERRALRRYLVLAVAATVLVSATIAALVPLIAALVDRSTGRPDADVVTPFVVLVCLGIAAGVLDVASTVVGQLLGGRLILRMHEVMADRIARLPLGWFTGDRASGLNTVAAGGVTFAANAPDSLFRPLLAATIAPVLPAVVLLIVEWRIGLVVIVGAVLVALVWRATRRRDAQFDARVDELNGEGSARVLEFASAQPAVRAAGADSIAERSVRSAIEGQRSAARRSQIARGWSMSSYAATAHLVVLVAVALTVWLVVDGSLPIGPAVATTVVVVVLEWLALHGLPFGEGTALANRALERLVGLVDEPTLPEPERPAEPADASVSFEEVSFGYVPGTTVVHNVSFTAPTGGMTAIVGPSGSGKTTLTRLAARFFDVDAGTVRIGGVDVRDLGTARALEQVSVVFQDVYLFQGSLRENIRLGRADATDAEVLDAAERAGVAEIAERLPHGYDTVVGEGGGTLSGGERQRVSIARALLKDAPVVLLDEATAALDIESEALIQHGLAELSGKKTLIVVAHRLQTIRQADRIVVLTHDGGVEAVGDHETLLSSSAIYAGFWANRQESDTWSVRG